MSIEKQSVSEENLQGSWVELHFNNGGGGTPKGGSEDQSASAAPSGDLEKMLLDAQHESGRSSSRGSLPCDSPPRSQTPSHLRRGSEVHSSGEKNSSQVDTSSRLQQIVLKQSEEDYLERRKEVEILMKKNADWIWDWSSRPENLPPKEFLLRHPKRSSTLSMRNTSVMKKGGIFSAEFLKVFLPSLVLSHILAVGLGVYIGRRIATSGTF
ncbi:BCL2/adenovirus E1B 19 kDa protein-interacting protein 3 isoform X2 [Puntigrus tetrazona]|uniref:BCL2/adenovirus E1B 19 kDa protein-interacting protein 3 isoform X2 n=1 Tax=Puntigrus tetrazona TaxID=1606681 RepID=UPI001C8A9182|nr:BCL2/adenovirus E1B 19 kDa protein-interacting protein 3 isoform X2 [Puntigrus tetrazona]